MSIISKLRDINNLMNKIQHLADELKEESGVQICGIGCKIHVYSGFEKIEEAADEIGIIDVLEFDGKQFIEKTLKLGDINIFTLGNLVTYGTEGSEIIFKKADEPKKNEGEK